MKKKLTLANFNTTIEGGNDFFADEHGTQIIALIKKWNEYVEASVDTNKRLHIKWIEFSPETYLSTQIDINFTNIDIDEFRLHRERQLYVYLRNSSIGSLKFADPQNSLEEKVIQGDGKSFVKELEFDNIHFSGNEEESLIIFNLNIENLRIIRTINLSEKIQILGCQIKNFVINTSDLGKMLLIDNVICNLYIIGSAVYRTVLLSNDIGVLHRKINQIKGISANAPDIPYEAISGTCRQLKNAFDESKSYVDGDRFYADEMRYTMLNLSPLDSRKYLLFLHWLSSNFGTSWIRAGVFVIFLGSIKTIYENGIKVVVTTNPWLFFQNFIDNVNPYTNFSEAKNIMPSQLLYLILLSYGIYQFALAIRRLSKR